MNAKQLAELNDVVSRQPTPEAKFVAFSNGMISHLSNAKVAIANGQAQAALQDIIDLMEGNKDAMAGLITGGAGAAAPAAVVAEPTPESEDQKKVKEAVLGMASFINGEDDAAGVTAEGLADYEPIDVQLNAGMVRSVLKAADVIRHANPVEPLVPRRDPTSQTIVDDTSTANTSADAPDWPPAGSAVGIADGTQQYGSTGQLFEARDGQWKRLLLPAQAPADKPAAEVDSSGGLAPT